MRLQQACVVGWCLVLLSSCRRYSVAEAEYLIRIDRQDDRASIAIVLRDVVLQGRAGRDHRDVIERIGSREPVLLVPGVPYALDLGYGLGEFAEERKEHLRLDVLLRGIRCEYASVFVDERGRLCTAQILAVNSLGEFLRAIGDYLDWAVGGGAGDSMFCGVERCQWIAVSDSAVEIHAPLDSRRIPHLLGAVLLEGEAKDPSVVQFAQALRPWLMQASDLAVSECLTSVRFDANAESGLVELEFVDVSKASGRRFSGVEFRFPFQVKELSASEVGAVRSDLIDRLLR